MVVAAAATLVMLPRAPLISASAEPFTYDTEAGARPDRARDSRATGVKVKCFLQ